MRTKRCTYPVYLCIIRVLNSRCVCVCVLTGLQREVINFNGMPNKNGRREDDDGGDRVVGGRGSVTTAVAGECRPAVVVSGGRAGCRR